MAETMATDDHLTLKTGLTAEERTARARKAGAAAHSISVYVQRICKGAPALTAEDLDALRRIVGPVSQPDVYAEGVRVGAKLALDRIVRLASEAG